ncbi:Chitin synthase regulatory factor 3 [Nosema granulosis]|uniref:Chitin synthase regulatory factor 3 n=1 Tax=Nosema granulosis TaxID=83296 RepID=A0A9P6L009_9MICR|nr:Chitin synthase regulatory factor 3 [Nosema granulosis]
MNMYRYKQEKKLFRLYSEHLNSNNIKKLLEFLGIYIQTYEDENSLMKCSIMSYNPLKEVENDFYEISSHYTTIIAEIDAYIIFSKKLPKNRKFMAKLIAYLGVAYENGLLGLSRNKLQAFKHYRQSAQLNCPYGTFRLAQCYEKGNGVQKNIKQALYFYRCAAKLGSAEALHTFGTILLQNNFAGEFNEEMGYVYLRIAFRKATKEYPYACFDYSRYVEHSISLGYGFFDIYFCFKSYLKGAMLECPNCQYKIGEIYEKGLMGEEHSLTDALKWYKKAAMNGQPDAQLKIADFLLTKNEFYPEDFELAYNYALKSAISENCRAAKYISLLFEKGIGISRNQNLSEWWNRIYHVYCKDQNVSPNQKYIVFEKLVNRRRPTEDIKVQPILTSNALKAL